MSGSYSMKGTLPAGPTRMKKGSLTTNGNGPPPLSYPADPPDDENMNEIINENITLTVHLPNGTTKQQTVESTVPMMDLLVTLAASNKLNPASHSLKILTGDKWKQIDFKANKTIGLLAGEDGHVSVQLVQKKDDKQKEKPAQPFEMTYRFTVNLPHKQKKVLRISPKLTLGELRQIICEDKAYDPNRYTFLLPGNPTNVLEDTTTVGDLKSSEIDFVSVAVLDAANSQSMPNLAFEMSRTSTDDSRLSLQTTGEKKAKRGFLSFLNKSKDGKKGKADGTSLDAASRTRKSESFNVRQHSLDNPRPHTMYDSGESDHFNLRRTTGDLHQYNTSNNNKDFRKSTGSNLAPLNENLALVSKSDTIERANAPKAATSRPKSMADVVPKKSGKKRAAPPPPQLVVQPSQQTVQVEIEVNQKQPEPTKVVELPDVRVPKKLHSRNSSDSSGYHELTVSGADSPEGVKSDNLQTTLDTTSIDSADNFNGDSGIRDMSPVHRNRNKTRTKEAGSRDSSLDDMDKADGPLLHGRKKKRAPLPPPGMSGSLNDSKEKVVKTSEVVVVSREDRQREEDEEFAALQAMEEVTMKFNIEDSDHEEEDDDMRMVENSSIHSEDLDISQRQRPPATFIAPPPPTEPPPDDSEQVDYNPILGTVTVGVGEDTTSLSPQSSKSKELQQAMPEFKDQINRLADEGEEEEETRSERSEQRRLAFGKRKTKKRDNDSDASFIIHDDVEDTKNKPFEAGFHADTRMPESSEITYNYTVDSVPAEFQNSDKDDGKESDEEVVMEEIVEYFPADRNIDLDSPRHKIPDLDSPKEHRSLAMHLKEEMSDMSVDDDSVPLSNSTPKDPKEATKLAVMEAQQREAEEERKKREAEEARKAQEPEEFVISLDELSNVDFSAPIPEEKRRSSRSELPKVNYRIEFRSSQDLSETPLDYLEDDSNSRPDSEDVFDNDRDISMQDDSNVGAKTMCSDISFTPSSEGEVEHVLEEKSISMIALPAERTPVKNPPPMDDVEDDTKTYASETKIVLSNSSVSASASPSSTVSNASPQKADDSFDAQSLMQAQYGQLQSQFTMWQTQLLQNQKQLSSQDEQSNLQLQQLQLQMQMQQQMMMQLQQSMQTLALQNTMVSQQTSPRTGNQQVMAVPVETVLNEPQTLPEPEQYRPPSPVQQENVSVVQAMVVPPAPPAPKPKPVKADAKYSKPKPRRIETQLDPREKLMLDIRNFGKISLKKVPVKATHWHK